jgi:FkbM family methyltransferase
MVLGIWPAARVACFEPLRHGRAQIEAKRRRFPNIDIHGALVGSTEKAGVEMHVAESSSSLLRDAHNQSFPVEIFPQTTIDATVRTAYAGRAPDLLKIDVQGYELEVLKGSEASLSRNPVGNQSARHSRECPANA